jgi:hypothetical protein
LVPFHALADAIFSNEHQQYRFFSFKFRERVMSLKDDFEKPTTSHVYRDLVVAIKNDLNHL